MPLHYTQHCWPKSKRTGQEYRDARLTLVGNAWCVQVVAWLIGCLTARWGCHLGSHRNRWWTLASRGSTELQRLLLRPPVRCTTQIPRTLGVSLVRNLAGLIQSKARTSCCSPTGQQVKYQRLRAALPSRLWKWKTVAGWRWTGNAEHINVLELRAINTTIRWWVTQGRAYSWRMVHLTNSLVCLHS